MRVQWDAGVTGGALYQHERGLWTVEAVFVNTWAERVPASGFPITADARGGTCICIQAPILLVDDNKTHNSSCEAIMILCLLCRLKLYSEIGLIEPDRYNI